MGLLTGLVTLPLAPVRGVHRTLVELLAAAEREQRAAIQRDLADLEAALLAGEITPEEFDEREDELLDELAELDAATQGDGINQTGG
ncbi:gas vesicle protein GvpG [Gandjariella thermophila]|uniref:gas vesicle protein GvpG n=1 Tax=Gandjariella thermophila TaxID=1931992 RepID=UPI0010F9D3F3|nr:gas vesicle protein GvpG [Gandjariella thermophila]